MTLAAYSSWAQPTSFITSDTGSITVSGNQTATGSGSFAFTGPTTLDANLITAQRQHHLEQHTTLGEANSTLNAGTATTDFASTLADGSHNLTLTGDNLTFGGNVSGTGSLTIQPYTASTILHINDGTSSGLYLSSAEQGYLQPGFSRITIGNTADTGAMTEGASTWTTPLSAGHRLGRDHHQRLAAGMGSNSFTLQTNTTPDLQLHRHHHGQCAARTGFRGHDHRRRWRRRHVGYRYWHPRRHLRGFIDHRQFV